MLGFGAVGQLALGQLPHAGTSLAVCTSSGASSFSSASVAVSKSVLSASGIGAFAGTMNAAVSMAVSFTGSSSFGPSNSPSAIAAFSGLGTFAAVSYTFYGDAETAGPANEVRYVVADSEYRVDVAPAEDRVYYVDSKPEPDRPPNRRRML